MGVPVLCLRYQGWGDFANQSYAFENTQRPSGVRAAWTSMFPRSRKDMIMLFDNGWATTSNHLTVDTQKFPRFAASTPLESLTKMSAAVKAVSDHLPRTPPLSNQFVEPLSNHLGGGSARAGQQPASLCGRLICAPGDVVLCRRGGEGWVFGCPGMPAEMILSCCKPQGSSY